MLSYVLLIALVFGKILFSAFSFYLISYIKGSIDNRFDYKLFDGRAGRYWLRFKLCCSFISEKLKKIEIMKIHFLLILNDFGLIVGQIGIVCWHHAYIDVIF
jgi:hypothetical protein